MIPYHIPSITGDEEANLREAIASGSLAGDGPFTRACHAWLEDRLGCPRVLLTPSAPSAMELAFLVLGVGSGDEVIMPCLASVAAANAVALRGATPVFVDVRPDTLNLDESLVAAALSARTRAIMVRHNAGVACAMAPLTELARQKGIPLVEDASESFLATWNGRSLGTIGELGVLSFHQENGVQCGDGGALLINEFQFVEPAEVIRQEGTDRVRLERGLASHLSWMRPGIPAACGELAASFLRAQLDHASTITGDRRATWTFYAEALAPVAAGTGLELPSVPSDCRPNGHAFELKVPDAGAATALLHHLEERGIAARPITQPLHRAPGAAQCGRLCGEDHKAAAAAARTLRLPLYWKLPRTDAQRVVDAVTSFAG